MALRKVTTDAAGVTTEYIRVAGHSHDRDSKTLHIHLKVYRDASARKEGLLPVREESVSIRPSRQAPGEAPTGGAEKAPTDVAECYALLKKIDAYSDAEDV